MTAILLTAGSAASTLTFPGQAGNPVGFAVSPGWPGTFQNVALGLPSPCTIAQYATTIYGGTIPNSVSINYIDFLGDFGGLGAVYISNTGTNSGPALSNVTFKGCRFQSQATFAGEQVVLECYHSGSSNITFYYCSITPLSTLWTAPPNAAWPASSAGTGVVLHGPTYANYVIPYQDGYVFGTSPTNCRFDHCDIWGGGNLVNCVAGGTSLVVTDCWIHDARNQAPPNWSAGVTYSANNCVGGSDFAPYASLTNGNIGHDPSGNTDHVNWQQISGPAPASPYDHTDGVGFYQGGNAPTNQTFNHCTIAMLGNTDLIGLQSTTSQYTNWTLTNNYLSGDNVLLEGGDGATGTNTNVIVTGNIFATDLVFNANLVNHTNNPMWRANGNTWRNNKFKVFPGDTWSGLNAFDGYYVWPATGGPQSVGPAGVLNITDFV